MQKFTYLIFFSGGSSGIGRGTVLLLSKLGCKVAFGGRNKAELDDVAAKCKETRKDAQVTVWAWIKSSHEMTYSGCCL